MGYIRARDAEVPPLPGLSCRYRLCFPRLPPWATLSRPSGTPGNTELTHYDGNVLFDGRVHALIGCEAMCQKLFATDISAGRLR
jgi:hypothetical protein